MANNNNNDFDFDDDFLTKAENFINDVNNNLSSNKIIKSSNNNNKIFENNNKKQNISNPNTILSSYLTRLKNFGFPQLGKITLSPIQEEQEKTFQFFDYLLMKKASNSEDYKIFLEKSETLTKKCESLEYQNAKYEKEIKQLNEQLRSKNFNKSDFEKKLKSIKDSNEKNANSLKSQILTLNNKISKLSIEKRTLEEKNNKLIENLNKFDINKPKIINSIENLNNIKKNNLQENLSKIKGAEKLVEMMKGGYNDSLRELLFEISALKNFILDLHKELCCLIDFPVDVKDELWNLPFLDTINTFKEVFTKNINLIKAKIGIDDDNINFDNLKKIYNDDNNNNILNNKNNISNNRSISEEENNEFNNNNNNNNNNNENEYENKEIDNDEIVFNKKINLNNSLNRANINNNNNINIQNEKVKNLLNNFEQKFNLNEENNLNENKNNNNKEENYLEASYSEELEQIKLKWAKAMMTNENNNNIINNENNIENNNENNFNENILDDLKSSENDNENNNENDN